MRLTLGTPWYFVLLCLLLGAGYAALLYFVRFRRDKAGSGSASAVGEGLGNGMRWLLSALRMLSVAGIAFLLLSPLVRRVQHDREKPIIIVAQDNSKSLDYCSDSALYAGVLPQKMRDLCRTLEEDYDVQCYSYGSDVRQQDAEEGGEDMGERDKSTDMSAMLSAIADRYAGRNVGAVLITGDGLWNQGVNPVSVAQQFTFPVYTLALGDTTARKDAAISHVKCNRVAYRDNQFPMEITVRASMLQGRTKQLTVTHNGRVLYSKSLTYNADDFLATETVLLDADQAGLQQYVVRIAPADEESSLRNNTYTVPVEVIDGHQKIALIAALPHPDVAALRRSIESRQNYEVEACLARDWKGNIRDYDMIILHQLPARGNQGGEIVAQAVKAHLPLMFVVGTMSDLPRFNALHAGVEIYSRLDRSNEATPLYNDRFTAFTLDEETARKTETYPPLTSPFGEYRTSGNTQALFSARIGTVNSGQPLVAVCQQQELRYAVVAGEGLWKWRLADYQQNGTNEHFDNMMNKLVTYTALRVDKERFRVNAKKVWRENEEVTLEAELYNENYEPVNQPEVTLELRNTEVTGRDADRNNDPGRGRAPREGAAQQRTALQYKFNKEGTGYTLNVGRLAPGTYNYKAATHYNGRALTAQGTLLVEDANLEDLALKADHALMNTLAVATGGEMLTIDRLAQFPDLLRQRSDVTPVIYSHQRYSELLNMPLVFILLMLLLTAEWVLRKYHGEI